MSTYRKSNELYSWLSCLEIAAWIAGERVVPVVERREEVDQAISNVVRVGIDKRGVAKPRLHAFPTVISTTIMFPASLCEQIWIG